MVFTKEFCMAPAQRAMFLLVSLSHLHAVLRLQSCVLAESVPPTESVLTEAHAIYEDWVHYVETYDD